MNKKVFRSQVLLTGLENTLQMAQAVPNSMKMCSAKEWVTIKDRHDPRVAGDIDGKSTLRTTIHALGTGLRIIEELKGDRVLDEWLQDYWVGELGQVPKTDAMIFGPG